MNDPYTNAPESSPPPGWQPPRRAGFFGSLGRAILMFIIIGLVVLPFTPMAGRIKRGLVEIANTARRTRIITREVTKEVQVPKEVVRIQQAPPPPPPPLPSKFVPRKEMDVTTLFNDITVNTKLETSEGRHAITEVEDPDSYKVTFTLSVKVPKPNDTIEELARINPHLPKMLPGLGSLVSNGKVSGFYHKLYDTKTTLVQRDLTRLNKLLDKHNFFDCETMLELADPKSSRKAFLIQSEMDVVADGTDGDRSPTLDDSISNSDYYQPMTSYFWKKRTAIPNPLLARWESKLETANTDLAKKGISTEKTRSLKALAGQLKTEIEDMKALSSLIADSDPFIVISTLFKPYVGSNAFAPQMGDLAVVIHGNQILPAICGDYGPTMKMGEASLFLAKQINAKATPYNRGEDALKVTYLIFPGTAKKPFAPPNLDEWRNLCVQYLNELGGVGDGYSVHVWENKFKNVPPLVPPNNPDLGPPAPPEILAAMAVKAAQKMEVAKSKEPEKGGQEDKKPAPKAAAKAGAKKKKG